MKRILIITITVLSFNHTTVAQSTNLKSKEWIKLQCLKTLDKLQENSRVKDNIEIYRFKKLFESDSVKIVNEVLPSNSTNREITVSEYLELMYKLEMGGTMNVFSMRPYNMEISEINSNGDAVVKVDLQKVMGLLSLKNIFYKDTLNISYILNYSAAKNEFTIKSASLNSEAGFFLVLRESENLQMDKNFEGELNVNGTKQKISEGYILLRNLKSGEKVVIEPFSEDYLGNKELFISSKSMGENGTYKGEPVLLNFKPKGFFLWANTSIGNINDNIILSNEQGEFEGSGSLDVIEFQLGIGYRIFSANKWALDAKAGMGTQSVEGTYDLSNYESIYENDEDEDWVYNHNTRVEDLSEFNEVSSLSYGAALQLHYKINRLIKVNAEVGYRSLTLYSANYQSNIGFIAHEGRYQESGPNKNWSGTIDDNSNLGFGTGENENGGNELVGGGSSTILHYGLGLDFRLTKRLHLGLSYFINDQSIPFEKQIVSIRRDRESEIESIHYERINKSWNYGRGALSIRYFL